MALLKSERNVEKVFLLSVFPLLSYFEDSQASLPLPSYKISINP